MYYAQMKPNRIRFLNIEYSMQNFASDIPIAHKTVFQWKKMNIFLLTVKMNEQGNVKGVPKTRHTDIFSIPSNIPGMFNGFLVVLSCKSVS